MSYHDGEHYNSVRALDGSAAAAVQATLKAPASAADDEARPSFIMI